MSKKSTKKKIVLVAVISLIVLVIAVVAWLVASDRLLVRLQQPGENSVARQKVVCDADTVNTYNEAIYYKPRGDNPEPNYDAEGLKNLVDGIKSKSAHQNDPTCQSILFWSAVMNRDAEAATEAYEAVAKLHDKRIFADSNLRGNQPLQSYSDQINSLKTTPEEAEQ